MINIRDLRIDPASLGGRMLLVDITPAYVYKDGIKTKDISGYKYAVALPEHHLEKITVKIDGEQQIDLPNGYVDVAFVGLEVVPYEMQGHIQIAAKAAGIKLVKDSK